MSTEMPYPFDRLPRVSREQARVESVVARWLSARGQGHRLAKLVGGPVRARVVAATVSREVGSSGLAGGGSAFDPFAAVCIVKAGGASIEGRGSSVAVRRIAQSLLGGPAELPAPRPLTVAEESIWCLVVATALEDLGVEGMVWPRRETATASSPTIIALDITLDEIALPVELVIPPDLELRAPPPTPIPGWADRTTLDVPIILGRCALARTALDRLSVRSLITLETPPTGADLEILGGTLGIRAAPKSLVAEVVTGYLPRDMTLPDAAHVELTVALGTTQLSLRQVFELSIGQIVSLGRPLAGPFELRAAGRVVGKGELVDVDGELAVRIVSLGDQE